MTAPAANGEPLSSAYQWDFFLSHRSGDTPVAKRLKDALHPPAEVFLDEDSIQDGEESLTAVKRALNSSLIYVFLISLEGEAFNYLRVELDYALQLIRENPNTSRVVPIYLYRDAPLSSTEVPLGLGVFKGVVVPDPTDLSGATERLRRILEHVKPLETKRRAILSEARAAVAGINGSGLGDISLGVTRATGLVRSLFYTLLALDVTVFVAALLCVFLTIWTPRVFPALVVLSVFFFALLTATFRVLASALGTTGEINRRDIQGA